jgi:hypothetical protein
LRRRLPKILVRLIVDESAITVTGDGFLQNSLAWVPWILSHMVWTIIGVSLPFSRHPIYYTTFYVNAMNLTSSSSVTAQLPRRDHSITSLGTGYFKDHINISAAASSKSCQFNRFFQSLDIGVH